MKPRLLVVGPVPPPLHGVTVSTSLVLANPLLRKRFHIDHLDTSDHRDRGNVGRWDLTNILLGLRDVARLQLMMQGRQGVLYLPLSQSSGGFLRDSLFIRTAAARGWKVAVHLRGSELWAALYAGRGRALQYWVRSTLQKVASAAVMGEALNDAFGDLVPASRLRVVQNGTPRVQTNDVVRDRRQVLFLSHLRRRKGAYEAVEAAILTLKRVPDAHFVFAGAWESPEFEHELRSRTRRFDKRIAFCGVVSGDAKDELLARSAVLLFPPREPEGHPRVVLEALSVGLPIVTTNRGAIADTVEDGISGFVLADPQPEALADRLICLLEDDDLYESMSRAALNRYEDRFTQEAADRHLSEWLTEVATAVSRR